MSPVLQLILGIAILIGGVLLYRKRRTDPDGPHRYGSQAGTFVIIIGLMLAVYALGRMGVVW